MNKYLEKIAEGLAGEALETGIHLATHGLSHSMVHGVTSKHPPIQNPETSETPIH